MGQVLSICKGCDTPRGCDNCPDLHNWIVDALVEKAELQAYRDTGLEPEEINRIKADVVAGCLKQTAKRYGHWIEYMKVIIPEPFNKWEQAWRCSECGFDDGFITYDYCPSYGANMELEEEDKSGTTDNTRE